jgi:nitrous oxidase accessory protein NosD
LTVKERQQWWQGVASVHDGKAAPKDNHIHEGNDGGVVIIDKAKATLENNDIHSNTQAGVEVQGEGSEAVLKGNHIHDGKAEGVVIVHEAKATLENNDIIGNDLDGVRLQDHTTAFLTSNTIKGDGVCLVERTEEELAVWTLPNAALYRSPGGFPGLRVSNHSTVFMSPGSNVIEGNGKAGPGGTHAG